MQLRALATLAALGALAHADVVTLPAARDNTLWNDQSGGTSSGQGHELFVGRAGGTASFPIRRGLIAFDVAALIPAGATINSAQLTLTRTNGNNVARTIELHRTLATWGEGASVGTSGQGAPSAPDDATWIHRTYPTANWAAAGGDFDASISASTIVGGPGVFTFGPSAALTADVQAWLDGSAVSAGWLLKDSVETQSMTTHVFGTREHVDPAARPLLVVDFTPAQSTFTYCVAKLNSLGCTPAIGWSGAASASAGSGFDVTLANVFGGKSATLFYGVSGAAHVPFLGGSLCMQAPRVRTQALTTGGNANALDCSGVAALDFNARIASGVDPALVAGAIVWCQWRSRDPLDATGVSSSDALRFEIAP